MAAKEAQQEYNASDARFTSLVMGNAAGKRPAAHPFDMEGDPKWVKSFSQKEYVELVGELTKLKAAHNAQRDEWAREINEKDGAHEEAVADVVANAVCAALQKRAQTKNIAEEAMLMVENVLKAKESGHQKVVRGLVSAVNPNLLTRQLLRRVCHTFKDLYQLLEINLCAKLPNISLLEKDRLTKERLADYFRVNLCDYKGSCEGEAKEEFCTEAFSMSLYKADGLRLYITKDGVARGKDTPWTLDDGSVVQTPPGEPAHVVTVAIAAHTHGGCTHRWWGSQLARRTSFSPKRRMRFLERVRAPLAPRTLSKSDLRLSLRGGRPKRPSGEVGPLGTLWGLYAPIVRRSARAPNFVLAEKTYAILREGSWRRWRPEPSPR